MAYDVSNLKGNQGGATLERSDREVYAAGVYEHPETGKQIITLFDPLFGNVQSEGVARLGFVRVRDAEPEEVKSLVEANLEEKNKDNADYKGLAARLSQLESVQAQNVTLQAEVDALRKEKLDREGREVPSAAEDQSAKTARENAAEVTDDRENSNTEYDREEDVIESDVEEPQVVALADPGTSANVSGSPATGDTGDGTFNQPQGGANEKPLEQQNKSELRDTAAQEGVELTDEHDTNKKIVEAIKAKRDEREADVAEADGGNQ